MSVDDEWISKVCRLLAEECAEEWRHARSLILNVVEEVERELDEKARQWRAEWPGHSEVWALYSRLIEAIELLMKIPDRAAAERLCETLKRVRSAVESVLFS